MNKNHVIYVMNGNKPLTGIIIIIILCQSESFIISTNLSISLSSPFFYAASKVEYYKQQRLTGIEKS